MRGRALWSVVGGLGVVISGVGRCSARGGCGGADAEGEGEGVAGGGAQRASRWGECCVQGVCHNGTLVLIHRVIRQDWWWHLTACASPC